MRHCAFEPIPAGPCLSLERRSVLLDWAARTGGWIVENVYTGEFRYAGSPLPALKRLDAEECVFYVGTFSKTLFPGLRIGYLVIPKSQFLLIRDQVRRLDGGHSVLEEVALADFVGISADISNACEVFTEDEVPP